MLRKCRNDLQAEVTALKDQLANAQKTADGNVTTMRGVLQHLHEASSEFSHVRQNPSSSPAPSRGPRDPALWSPDTGPPLGPPPAHPPQ
jgi:hypothetical protein